MMDEFSLAASVLVLGVSYYDKMCAVKMKWPIDETQFGFFL